MFSGSGSSRGKFFSGYAGSGFLSGSFSFRCFFQALPFNFLPFFFDSLCSTTFCFLLFLFSFDTSLLCYLSGNCSLILFSLTVQSFCLQARGSSFCFSFLGA